MNSCKRRLSIKPFILRPQHSARLGRVLFHPRLGGTYYDMGFQYGTVLFKHGFRVPEQSGDRLSFGRECEKEVKRIFPDILDEIHGFADACHASYEHLSTLILNVGAFKPSAACSVFAASTGLDILFARNYDFYYKFKEHSERYLTRPSDGYMSVADTDIFVGREDGVNEKGLAIGMNFVSPRNVRAGINFALLVRYVLDKCAAVEESVKVLTNTRHLAADNYLIADKEGQIAVVEACPDRVRVRKPGENSNFMVSTNHFVHSEMLDMENQKERPPDSEQRYKAIHDKLQVSQGQVTLKDAQKILSDHRGFVCSHVKSIQLGTLWSMIAALKKLRVVVAEGHPCRTKYKVDTRLNKAIKGRQKFKRD